MLGLVRNPFRSFFISSGVRKMSSNQIIPTTVASNEGSLDSIRQNKRTEKWPRHKRKKLKKQNLAEEFPMTFTGLINKSGISSELVAERNVEKFLSVAAREFSQFDDRPNIIDWNLAMQAVQESEKHFPLDRPKKEELEDIKEKGITYNLAKVLPNSFTLKKMIDLGVDLANWEKNNWLSFALTLDFERDVKPKILFLRDLGLAIDDMAYIFTESAEFFQQDTKNLEARVRYLESKDFSRSKIKTIISEDPQWLTFTIEEIDARLGYFQKTFSLSGNNVRALAVTLPALITWHGVPGQINLNLHVVKDFLGFSTKECQSILLAHPETFMVPDEEDLNAIMNFLHNEVGFPHKILVKFPQVFTQPLTPIKPRLEYLKKLGRDQFDPKKPNYVSPELLVKSSDSEFCAKVAKTTVAVYNEFLKTI